MDWTALVLSKLDWAFFLRVLNIILIDLILAGDNAVVIAMAVRSLPRRQRHKGIILGAGTTAFLRVVLTFFAARLLEVQFVKLIGGVLMAWIAVKLFVKGGTERAELEAMTLPQAIWLILVADLTMSMDNVLAVAAISRGDLTLLIFGLSVSVAFVIFTSGFLSMLMDRYPVFIYLGSAILGRVAAEMIFSDPLVEHWLNPSPTFSYAMQALFTVGVVVIGKLYVRLVFRRAEKPEAAPEPRTSPGENLPPRRSEER